MKDQDKNRGIGDGGHRSLVLMAGVVGLLMSAVCTFGAPALDLRFKDSVQVNDTIILLRDVCVIDEAGDALLRERVAQIVIGEAAPAGYARFVSSDDVVRMVERVSGTTVVLRKAKRIHVGTLGVRHTVAEFQDEINGFIIKSLGLPKDDVSVAYTDTGIGFICLDKPFVAGVKESVARVMPGNNTLRLEIRQGSVTKIIPVPCRVSVVADVVIAAQDIPRATPLSTANCTTIRKTLENVNLQPCFTMRDALGNKTRMSIRRGTMICAQHLEKIPLIAKGQNVSLTGSQGRLRISVNCIARESGSMGERIWVENESSHKLIRGVVTGAGEVGTIATGKERS